MSTPTRPPMTRPRLSQLTLEGAAATVSTMLLLWLLLWFARQAPTSSTVRAFQVPLASLDAPHLAADVRGLSRPGMAGRPDPTTLDDVAAGLERVVASRGSAVVVYLAAPTMAEAKGPRGVVDLVRRLARSAHRDVLIALDLAQVDTDLDLGVFGNAPTLGLEEQLKAITPADPGARIAVMCSAAPGQKSWTIEGQGRSAFALFLQQGLAARPRTDVDALHRFVSRNVRAWVEARRRGAIQTPTLLAVGGKPVTFPLPPVSIQGPGASAAEPDPPTPRAEPAEKAARPPAVEGPLDGLFAQWDQHERLLDRAPDRHAPARWRRYQSALLRAERLARAAFNDPDARKEAADVLELAERARSEVKAALDQADQARASAPIRPVAAGDRRGARALNDSLKYLTGRGLDALESLSPPDPAPRPPADPAARGARKAGVEGGEESTPPPPELKDAADEGRPRNYLELQLPAWALQFARNFNTPNAFKDRRGRILGEAVLKRLPAEEAIALDPRGLDWIKAPIRQGDEARRPVQDELFVRPEDSVDDLEPRVAEFGARYNEALAVAQDYRAARSLFDRIAAGLPYYGEWAVLEDERSPVEPQGPRDAPSPRLVELIAATGRLREAVEGRSPPRDLPEIRARAERAFDKLEAEYRGRVGALLNQPAADWRDLDDVLVTPSIRPKDRKELLRQAVRGESAPAQAAPEPVPAGPAEATTAPSDPGFRRRALGMARLDLALRALGTGSDPADDPQGRLAKPRKLLDELANADDPRADDPAVASALQGLARYREWVVTTRTELAADRARARPVEGRQDEDKVKDRLMSADREARFRTAREAQDDDGAAAELARFSARASLRFHAERLAEDFAPGVNTLLVEAERAYPDRVEDRALAVPGGSLRLVVDSDPVAIEEAARAGTLRVGLEVEGDAKDPHPIPAGTAFVGVVAPEVAEAPATPDPAAPRPVRLRVALGDGRGPALGGPIPVPPPTPRPSAFPLAFKVQQLDSAEAVGARKTLAVRAFYRGRVDAGSLKDVAVALCKFAPGVTITIAHDRRELDRIYTPAVASRIKDQFEDHPDRGYFRARGKLYYVLTIRNRTPDTMDVRIERTLAPANGDGKERKFDPLDVRLFPGGRKDLPGSVSYIDVPADKPHELVVKVTDTRKQLLQAEHKVLFTQLRLEDAVGFELEPGQFVFEGEVDKRPGFKIRVVHKADSPAPEPIAHKDIRYFIEEKMIDSRLDPAGFLFRGFGVYTPFAILPSDTIIPWKVVVEESEHADKYRVR